MCEPPKVLNVHPSLGTLQNLLCLEVGPGKALPSILLASWLFHNATCQNACAGQPGWRGQRGPSSRPSPPFGGGTLQPNSLPNHRGWKGANAKAGSRRAPSAPQGVRGASSEGVQVRPLRGGTRKVRRGWWGQLPAERSAGSQLNAPQIPSEESIILATRQEICRFVRALGSPSQVTKLGDLTPTLDGAVTAES